MAVTEKGFALQEIPVDPPVHKVFPTEETDDGDAPAIHAYRRMGFAFCGLDTALYDGTPSSGEQALYMSMPCP